MLVGRPNVGKSTLFNRLTGTRRAIVTAVPGTTRDVLTHPVVWEDHGFELTDTGGMFGAWRIRSISWSSIAAAARSPTADAIVFVVDGREGLVPGDRGHRRRRARANVPAILAVNKTDDRRARAARSSSTSLGFDPILEVSAEHGHGVGDLLDEIVKRLPRTARARGPRARADDEAVDTAPARAGATAPAEETAVAIVGRPNAGKSSLVNRLLREERMIVSEMPGTTRDAVDTVLMWHRRQFRIVDTAGIRRPGRVAQSGQVESVSVLLARRAIEQADVVVLVIDAHAGVTDQDAAIAGEADKAGRGVIIAANKWDLMKDAGPGRLQGVRRAGAPPVEVSRLRADPPYLGEDRRADAEAARDDRQGGGVAPVSACATPELNRFIDQVTSAARAGESRATATCACSTPRRPASRRRPSCCSRTSRRKLHFSYERYLENRLRETYGFVGTPLRITVRKRSRGRADRAKSAEICVIYSSAIGSQT